MNEIGNDVRVFKSRRGARRIPPRIKSGYYRVTFHFSYIAFPLQEMVRSPSLCSYRVSPTHGEEETQWLQSALSLLAVLVSPKIENP